MSKYEVGDKVVMEITDKTSVMEEPVYILSDMTVVYENYIDKAAEPLSVHTEPLEAKIRRQAAEITRLLRENKELKAENGNSLWNIEQARAEGQNEAWSLCNEICKQRKVNEIQDMFNHLGINEFCQLFDRPYSEIAEKFAKWEKAKEENKVRVGDVLHYKYDKTKCICVTAVESNNDFNGVDEYGNTFLNRCDDVWEKTGRHIDIDSFLKQIGEE